MIIWHDILFAINMVSKKLQAKSNCIDSAMKQVEGVVTLHDEVMAPIEILEFVNTIGCYPNIFIAYRILLTTLVTVASMERSFSKLKLLKNYLRSSMS
ncbi:putative HAT dimerization domain-containing protein [Arabidopsis thaliana]